MLERPSFLLLTLSLLMGCQSTEEQVAAPAPSEPASTPPASSPPAARANGTLGEWSTLPAIPTPRGNHCAVAANGFLVVIGGNYKPAGTESFKTISEVHVAKIIGDGTLGEWKVAGTTPKPVSSCTAASDGTDVYLVDGIFDDEAAGDDEHKVRRTAITESGSLGTWQDVGTLPPKVRALYSNASVQGGSLRAFSAKLPDDGDGIALVRAPIASGAGGSLGTWQDTKWLAGFRGQPQYVFANAHDGAWVYALGGYAGASKSNAMLADGAGASLDAAGSPGASFPVSALPKATAFGKAVSVDDWIFVVGGKDKVLDGKGRAEVFAAQIMAGGALTEWTTVDGKLPQGRTSLAVVASGDFLYVVGGGYDAGGLDSVFSARVRFER
jgi:hypothetical protein